MNQPSLPDFKGMASLIRTIHSSIGVVALLFLVILVLALAFIFAPIPNLAKYVALLAVGGFGFKVWRDFWSHAKQWPAPVTERYFLALLEHSWGTQIGEVSSQSQLTEPTATGTPSAQPPPQAKGLKPQ